MIGYLKRLSADPPKPNPILGRAIGLGAILMLTPEYLMGRCNRRMFTRRSLAVETSFSSGPNAKTAASDSCDDTASTTAKRPQGRNKRHCRLGIAEIVADRPGLGRRTQRRALR
ncbi:MAG: hypothetical protein IID45_11150 [Planctomycetes bacterium]|nr:hypothetical protein [Planctomycetota bacterium]